MANLKWLLVGGAVLLGLFFAVRSQQSGYATRTNEVFSVDEDRIFRMAFEKDGQEIALEKKDGQWQIAGHDTLEIKAFRLDAFFDQVLTVSRETMMTQRAENWGTYSVDDDAGTHVRLYDASGQLLVHAVFGQSRSDWARNYVRIGDGPEVYLTDQNVLHLINASPHFWGEKPALPDSAEVEKE